MLKVALLDDYGDVGMGAADWNILDGIAEIDVFHEPIPRARAAEVLRPYDVLCTIRERTGFPRELLSALPNLKLVTMIGRSLANFDMEAATELGIAVVHPGGFGPDFERALNATPELTWALVLASVRNIVREDKRVRAGLWQHTLGMVLAGRTLGLLGLGYVGQRVAGYGRAFGMDVIAWSQNLTDDAAAGVGARRVEKHELFERADVLSIHVQLSERTRGLVGAHELGLMKPGAHLVNTARGPIVDEAALIAALREGRLAGAGLDVFDHEPLPAGHPLTELETVTLAPHLGIATPEMLEPMYRDKPEAILAYARGAPIRIINPQALEHPRQTGR